MKKRARKAKESKISKSLYWTPRILSIIFLLFLALFSLDIFELNLGFWGTLFGLFMHNIPVIILSAVLIFSWKREWLAAIVFIFAGLLYSAMVIITAIINTFEFYYISWLASVAGPAFLIGILYWLNWKKRKKQS